MGMNSPEFLGFCRGELSTAAEKRQAGL